MKNIYLKLSSVFIILFLSTGKTTSQIQSSGSDCFQQAVTIYNYAYLVSDENVSYAFTQFLDYLDSCTNVVQLELQN